METLRLNGAEEGQQKSPKAKNLAYVDLAQQFTFDHHLIHKSIHVKLRNRPDQIGEHSMKFSKS
jgi:hypothetical protein